MLRASGARIVMSEDQKSNSSLKRNGIEYGSNVELYSEMSLGKRRKDSGYWSSMQDKMKCGHSVNGSC